jgi:hypothetical protein
MKKSQLHLSACLSLSLIFVLCLCSGTLDAKDRFQIELYAGISYLNPKDLNLLSVAEEQYNDFYFIQRQLYKQGYFVNDFPQITSGLPFGLRLKYWISPRLSFSVSAERFSRRKELSVEGTLTYSEPTWFDNQTKAYDPYCLELSSYTLMGGIHYLIPIGGSTELEMGASAGWGNANFEFSSTWSHSVHFWAEDYWEFQSVDGGTLEENGRGGGFLAQISLRINQQVGHHFGIFVESSGTHWLMKSIEGDGRETRLGLPGETTWEGNWAIKAEELHLYQESRTVYVPTNYWENWTESQRDRDFILDISSVEFVLGIYLKF